MADEIRKLQQDRSGDRALLAGRGQFDKDIYGADDKELYVSSISASNDDGDSEEHQPGLGAPIPSRRQPLAGFLSDDGPDVDASYYRENNGSGLVNTRIADRESEVSIRFLSKLFFNFIFIFFII
jgi:hypothetical protein